MSKHPDPPLNPLALHIDQYSHEQADKNDTPAN